MYPSSISTHSQNPSHSTAANSISQQFVDPETMGSEPGLASATNPQSVHNLPGRSSRNRELLNIIAHHLAPENILTAIANVTPISFSAIQSYLSELGIFVGSSRENSFQRRFDQVNFSRHTFIAAINIAASTDNAMLNALQITSLERMATLNSIASFLNNTTPQHILRAATRANNDPEAFVASVIQIIRSQ